MSTMDGRPYLNRRAPAYLSSNAERHAMGSDWARPSMTRAPSDTIRVRAFALLSKYGGVVLRTTCHDGDQEADGVVLTGLTA